jgi:hypothetical protein
VDALPRTNSHDKPVLLGGIRSFSNLNQADHHEGKGSEAKQAVDLVRWVRFAESIQWSDGVVVGDFMDWEGAVPSISGTLQGKSSLYSAGMVREDRKPRLSYRKLRELWVQNLSHPLASNAQQSPESPYLLIAGFAMMFVLFYSMKQNNILRVNISRSLISPKGLFEDIFHSRYFQFGQTLLLMVLISGTLGLVAAGWLYSRRVDPSLDWLIGYIVHSEIIVEWLATLFWQPVRAFLFFWMLFFVIIWINALYASFLCSFFKSKCSLAQCLDLVVWSENVLVGVLPFAIFSDRIYSGNAHLLFSLMLIVFGIWGFLRLMWVFRSYIRRSLGFALSIWAGPTIMIAVVIVLLLEYNYSIFTYGEFFWTTVFHK